MAISGTKENSKALIVSLGKYTEGRYLRDFSFFITVMSCTA